MNGTHIPLYRTLRLLSVLFRWLTKAWWWFTIAAFFLGAGTDHHGVDSTAYAVLQLEIQFREGITCIGGREEGERWRKGGSS